MAAKVTINTVNQYLDDNDTKKYFIEYNGFLANHFPHAVVALYRLGSNTDYFQRHVNHHVQKYEKPDGPASTKQQEKFKTNMSMSELRGERTAFYQLVDHFNGLYKGKYGSSVKQLVAGEFPALSLGLSASLIHPLIHIGYGLSIDHSRTVIEGLAYLHHSYFAPKVDMAKLRALPNPSKQDLDFLVGMKALRNDEALKSHIQKRYKEILDALGPEESHKYFQCKVQAAFEWGDHILNYLERIKIPQGCDVNDWIVDQALKLFLAHEKKNDFFILHGVTSAWSLKQIAPLLKKEESSESAYTLLIGLVAVYFAQGAWPIIDERLNPASKGELPSWDEIKERTLYLDPEQTDEHVYKLVQVCWEQEEEAATKGIKDDMRPIYKLAALSSIENPRFIYGH